MADAISIEETNRVRVALGLKALPVPGQPAGPVFTERSSANEEDQDRGSTLETRQAAAYDNWKKIQDEAAAKSAREAKREAIKRARDAASRFAKLEGKGLGETDEGGGDDVDLDARSWLARQRKRQRQVEKARRLERELAEREEAAAAAAEHTATDLAGIKVAHEVDAFEDGTEQVLTLKDTTIDENEEEGDELENLELKEKERLEERLVLKKKKPAYNPNDVEDGVERSILGQYDDEIDGKKRKRFTLDGQGMTVEGREALKAEATERLKAQPISLDVLKPEASSDYLDPSELRIRKPKKKAKSTRRKAIDEDDIFPPQEVTSEPKNDLMDMDSGPNGVGNASKKRTSEDANLMDDEDLQASLAIQRRDALKKRKRVRPEDLARQIREEASTTPGPDGTTADEDVGLVIDETSEFVSNIQKPTAQRPRRPIAKPSNGVTPTANSTPAPDADGDGDVEMSHADAAEAEVEADANNRAKRATSTPGPAEVSSTGLDSEVTLKAGIGSTLTLLSQRGLLKPKATEDLNGLHRERQRFLAEKQRREAEAERRARQQRERDRSSGKLDRMSGREKEAYAQQENKQRDQFESRQMADVFNREYKPDIEIRYTDEFGREMNQKEAFKHLSHQFHGKGSGKQKTEKRLKQIDDERRREAKSALDGAVGSGMGNAAGLQAKRAKTAGVRLQ